jgi:hypothetical protein
MDAPHPSTWAPDEILRFYRAYHKYGAEFQKASRMVGGGKAPDMCEALWRRHQAYLSLDRKFQSEVAFVAMVQDSIQKAAAERRAGGGGAAAEADGAGGGAALGAGLDRGGDAGGLSGDDSDAREPARRPSRLRAGGSDDDDDDDAAAAAAHDDGSEEADAAAAVVAMASPGGLGGGTLAATRARRTPKRAPDRRSPGGGHTPGSAAKRARHVAASRGAAGGDDNPYEYYDEGAQAVTDSARKRRLSANKRLDFDADGGGAAAAAPAAGVYRPAPTRRKEAADEAKGIDALLALAEAGEEGEEEEQAGAEAEEEEEEEDEAFFDDADDEDFSLEASGRGGRRTPHTTPAKARSRPASAHATPRRPGGGGGGGAAARAGASPGGGLRGMGSPGGWLGGDGDLMGELGGGGEAPYLASPGFAQLPPGFVASPQNPMPRLRRRKHPPESAAALLSPIKSLFGRRQSFGGGAALLSSAALGYGLGGDDPGGGGPGGRPLSAPEARLRHCLAGRARRWARFEFFYSAVDRGWFLDSTVSELAAHVGLPADVRLTRREWSALRGAALGRPRRLSWRFLREERARLERWRAAARAQHGAGPDGGAGAAAAAGELPRALGVGQRVTARHPATRQLHDGSVLTVAADCYRCAGGPARCSSFCFGGGGLVCCCATRGRCCCCPAGAPASFFRGCLRRCLPARGAQPRACPPPDRPLLPAK